MKIICAGFPKTGTKSLHEALEILGFSIYDYTENMLYLGEEWQRMLDHGWSPDDFKRMYSDIDATCDVPASYFWYEMHKTFPDAKIILTTRASEEEWLSSVLKQLEVLSSSLFVKIIPFLSPTFRRIYRTQQSVERVVFGITQSHWSECVINVELMKKKYREHNAYVVQAAPSNQLLQYRVDQGWGPLCEFLRVPVPDRPFPHKNKGGDLIKENISKDPMLLQIKSEILSSVFTLSATFLAGTFYLARTKFSVFDVFSSTLAYFATARSWL